MAISCFKDVRFFVVNLGLLLLVDIFSGIYFRSTLTTIERRFQLPTTSIAFVASSYTIGNLVLLLFVSYYGSRWNRPRAIAIGSTLVVAGNLILTIPHFFGGEYQYVDTARNSTNDSSVRQVELCSSIDTNPTVNNTCADSEDVNSGNNWFIVILLGNMLCGIGATPIQPLGMSYIDDFSHVRNTPVYIGAVLSIGLIGPPLGFLFGAYILNIWVDLGKVNTDEITITPQNPNWVGAWWLGFLISAALITITSISFWFFPRKLKKQEHYKKEPDSGRRFSLEKKIEGEFNFDVKDISSKNENGGFLQTFKRVISNSQFILLIAVYCFGSFSAVSVITFFPKYLEVQFGVSASDANMYYGTTSISCYMVGTIMGSFIMRRTNTGPVGMARMMVLSHTLGIILTVPLIMIGCSTIPVAGVTTPYANQDNSALNPISICNQDCECTSGTFAPICGVDDVTYLSPCHAGCHDTYSDIPGHIQNYTACRCLPEQSSEVENVQWSRPGSCVASECGHLLLLVLVLKALSTLAAGVGATPSYVFLIRSVSHKDKAFAIGLAIMATRVFGYIPSPIVFGKLIDSTCLYWGINACSSEGYCRIYDNDKYRTRFYAMIIFAGGMSCLMSYILYFVVRRKKPETKEDSEYKYVAGAIGETEIGFFQGGHPLLTQTTASPRVAGRLASNIDSDVSLDSRSFDDEHAALLARAKAALEDKDTEILA